MLKQKFIDIINAYDGYASSLIYEIIEIIEEYNDYVGNDKDYLIHADIVETLEDYVTEEDEYTLGPINLQYKIEEQDFVYKLVESIFTPILY